MDQRKSVIRSRNSRNWIFCKGLVQEANQVSMIEWDELKTVQKGCLPLAGININEDSWHKKQDLIWIPYDSYEMKRRELVRVHCGNRGHRAQAAIEEGVMKAFWGKQRQIDVIELDYGCIPWIDFRSGECIPRLLSTILNGQRPNKVVHIDALYMGSSVDGKIKYFLVEKNLSGYSVLRPSCNPDSDTATQALTKQIAAFERM